MFCVANSKATNGRKEQLIEEFKRHSSESRSCGPKSKSCSGSSESRESSESSEDICKVLKDICKDRKRKGDFPHPKRCDLYVKCDKKHATIKYCSAGFIFDRKLKECIRGDAETCTPIISTLPPSTTTPLPTTTWVSETTTFVPTISVTNATTEEPTTSSIAPPNFDGFCRGVVFPAKNVAFPGSCVYYIRCLFGHGIINQCSQYRIFDSKLATCVPGNQTTCQPNSI